MSVSHIEIRPNNVPSDNKIRAKDGIPVLSFNIGATDELLNTSTVRIEGKLNVYKANGTRVAAGDNIHINQRLGIYGAFSMLTLKSLKWNTELEVIRHYNRALNSYLPFVTNLQDHLGVLSQLQLTSANYKLQKESNLVDTGSHFCVSIPCGLLSAGNLPLFYENGTGGLVVDITLASDDSFLYGLGGDSTDSGGAYYELEDVKLIAETIKPPPDILKKMKSQKATPLEINTIATQYQSINSTNAIINMDLGLNNVLGVYCNFIKSNYLENPNYDSLATYPIINGSAPSNISELTFLKDGVKYPNDWSLNTNFKTNANTALCDPQVVNMFKNSIMYHKNTINNNLLSPLTNNRVIADIGDADFPLDKVQNTGAVFGIGVAYNTIVGGDGINLKNSNFSIQIDCDLNTDSPNTMFIFAHHKQQLIMSPAGITTMS